MVIFMKAFNLKNKFRKRGEITKYLTFVGQKALSAIMCISD